MSELLRRPSIKISDRQISDLHTTRSGSDNRGLKCGPALFCNCEPYAGVYATRGIICGRGHGGWPLNLDRCQMFRVFEGRVMSKKKKGIQIQIFFNQTYSKYIS